MNCKENISDVQNVTLVDNRGRIGRYSGRLTAQTQKPHGRGKMVYETNEVYEGQWFMGDWSGFGTHTNTATGETYEGGFMDNQRHGLGIFMFQSNPAIYEFAFQCGKMQKGKITYKDSTQYWGNVNETLQPHGRGKLTMVDGRVYDGEFCAGKMEGHGRMTLPSGQWYLGEWTADKKNGLGLEVDASGCVCHEGIFSNDKPIQSSSFRQRCRSRNSVLVYQNPWKGLPSLVGPIPRRIIRRAR